MSGLSKLVDSLRGRILLAALLSTVTFHAAAAQDSAKPRRVGWISINYEGATIGKEAAPGKSVILSAFANLGYQEGKNLILDMRWAGGRLERGAELARELLDAGAEVLVAGGYQLSAAALEVTQTVPVVGVGCGAEQLAKSLARPGSNFTGVTCQSLDLPAKHLQVLSEILTGERQIVALVNPNSRNAPVVTEQLKGAAAELKLVVPLVLVTKPEEIETAFSEIRRLGIRGAVVAPDSLFWGERKRLAAAASEHRIAIITSYRETTDLGGLLSYGNSITDLTLRAVSTVDKILKGAKPADLPMERPTKFEFVVNLKTARALGLTIPPSMLLRAGEVIE